jgi:hypothetical protein
MISNQIGKQVDGSHRVPGTLHKEGWCARKSKWAIAQGLPLSTGDKRVPKGERADGRCSVCHPHGDSGAHALACENEVSPGVGAADFLDRLEVGLLQLVDGVGKPSASPHVGVGEGVNIADVGQAQAPALHPGVVVPGTCTV